MAGEWLNGLDFQWMRDRPSDGVFLRGMALGVQMRQNQVRNEMAARELEGRLQLLDTQMQLKNAEIAAFQNTARGNAELATVLSETAGDWTNPANQARFWRTAAQYPHTMKSPAFKELVDNFQLADNAKLREQLLNLQTEGRVDLEAMRQTNRLDLLTQRLNRMSEMKLDDQAFKLEWEQLRNELAMDRDRAKAALPGNDRFDLNKSDEIAFRAELSSLKSAFDQGILEPEEHDRKREAVIAKYKARARTQPQSESAQPGTPTNTPVPKVLKFDPATGTFK